jgi:4-diphosphocytidyl-2-C-methyl-D-erythritol kinase
VTRGLLPVLSERARAKVNLTLRVLGKRPDGFHELDSVVAFADVADVITLTVGEAPTVCVYGPFAEAIVGENLAERALHLVATAAPGLKTGAITIEKHLPVAAGVGGGSADAAAVLRLLKRANPQIARGVDWMGIAAQLGSDVPVCLENRPCRMTGRGETLSAMDGFQPMAAVLVNPQVPVPADKTRQIFKHLAAGPLSAVDLGVRAAKPWTAAEAVSGINDLQAPATAVIPEIATVVRVLMADTLPWAARLSGAGPTCFALCVSMDDAYAVADRISAQHPTWWVRATTLS